MKPWAVSMCGMWTRYAWTAYIMWSATAGFVERLQIFVADFSDIDLTPRSCDKGTYPWMRDASCMYVKLVELPAVCLDGG
jgi:hypothetical protein